MKKPNKKKDRVTTREKILSAAMQEFSAKGLEGARVDEIAARAGCNKNMIYIYFGSKDDLFTAVLERMYEVLRSWNGEQRVQSLTPVEGVKALVDFVFDTFSRNPEFISLLNSENLAKARHIRRSTVIPALYNPLVSAMRDLLNRGVRDGTFRSGIDFIDLYISISALANYHISNRYTLSAVFGTDVHSKERRAKRHDHVVDMVLRYLCK